jgi:hypothetical protein
MKAIRTTLAIAVLGLMASMGAYAQQPPKGGEMSGSQVTDEGAAKKAKAPPSTVDPKAKKAEASAARKAGATTEGECGPDEKMDAGACKKIVPAKSTVKSADVKKEAVAAGKAGQTTTGEMSPPQKKDEGAVPKK